MSWRNGRDSNRALRRGLRRDARREGVWLLEHRGECNKYRESPPASARLNSYNLGRSWRPPNGEGPEKVPGFADTDRIVPHLTDEADGAPAQNVDIRTRPDATDAKAQA